MSAFAIVLSGGGERLAAWHAGLLAGLAEGGWDPRSAELVVGTSVGALLAERLAAGVDPRADAAGLGRARPSRARSASADAFARLEALWPRLGLTDADRWRMVARFAVEHSPGGEDAFVERVTARVSGRPWAPALEVVAVSGESGARVVLRRGDRIAPGRGVAASRAIPLRYPPVTVAGRPLVDGALGSATNADLVARPGIERAIVITGIPAEPQPGTVDDLWAQALERELAGLAIPVAVVRPSAAELGALGPDRMSAATAPAAVAAGRARGRGLAAQIRPRLAA